MGDLIPTVSSVALVTTAAGSLIPTATARGIAAGSVTPGQVVYADPTANNVLKLAQANSQLQAANVVGIALGSAAPNQPLTYAVSGDVALTTTPALTSGSVYVASHGTAGGIGSPFDLVAGDFVSVLGVANGTAAIRLGIIPAGAVRG